MGGKACKRNIRSMWRKKEMHEKNEIIPGNENNREVRKNTLDTKEIGKKKRMTREFYRN